MGRGEGGAGGGGFPSTFSHIAAPSTVVVEAPGAADRASAWKYVSIIILDKAAVESRLGLADVMASDAVVASPPCASLISGCFTSCVECVGRCFGGVGGGGGRR